MAAGKNNAAIAAALFLTERSVEKVIHSIFRKLGLAWESAVHKRVKAVVLYLADEDNGIAPVTRPGDTAS
jgi:DNA-binding NarL/FixJ family response regulator